VRGIYSHTLSDTDAAFAIGSFNPLKCAASIPTKSGKHDTDWSNIEFQSAEVRGIYSHDGQATAGGRNCRRFNPLKCAASIPTQASAGRVRTFCKCFNPLK